MSQLMVVLVGDIVDERHTNREPSLFDYDSPDEREVAALAGWLREAGYGVTVRGSVREFLDSPPSTSTTTLVFPLWRGGASRNRTAIVPAICEELRLPYVGGDAFVQSVCQNKALSKLWAHTAGFAVPRAFVLYSTEEAERCDPVSRLGSPVVVKPLASACSIGITDSSLCSDNDHAAARAKELFAQNLGPVMCEEFIQGNEVSLCIIEERGRIARRCVVGYRGANGGCPFYDQLFTFDAKIDEMPPWALEVRPEPLDEAIWQSCEAIIQWLGRVDYLRVDGRLKDGRFVLVELTPDIHLSVTSSFLGGFVACGVEPPDVLDQLMRTSLRNQGYWSVGAFRARKGGMP